MRTPKSTLTATPVLYTTLFRSVELAADLADRVEHVRTGLVGVSVAACHAVAGHHVLHRHGQRIGGVGRLPGICPLAAEHAARLAGEGPRAHGVARAGVEELLLLRGRQVGLLHREPQRAGPHALRPEGQRGSDLLAGADARSEEHTS